MRARKNMKRKEKHDQRSIAKTEEDAQQIRQNLSSLDTTLHDTTNNTEDGWRERSRKLYKRTDSYKEK